MNLVSLDGFRGMLRVMKKEPSVTLELITVANGFELECGGQILENSRGGPRVFKTMDAAYRYVCTRLVLPELNNQVELKIRANCAVSSLF